MPSDNIVPFAGAVERPPPPRPKKRRDGRGGDGPPPPPSPPPSPPGAGILPEDCPVKVLGQLGLTCVFLKPDGQLVQVEAKALSKLNIQAIFDGRDFLCRQYWPRTKAKTGEVIGFDGERAQADLVAACAAKGVFDEANRLRGAGAWRGEDGGLILHLGDRLIVGGHTEAPGVIGRHVYPAYPGLPLPSASSAASADIRPLYELLRTWNWQRPGLDPILLTGWIVAAFVGGALKWRPMVWITGDKGTGKSTLHRVIQAVFGSWLISFAETSAAGIYTRLRQSTRPVSVDELEAEEDNRRAAAVINLARVAGSGGELGRGSSDLQAQSFKLQSAFMFSSVLVPPMLPQDVSRRALLELLPLDGRPEPAIDAKALARIGAVILARWLDRWEDWGERLAGWTGTLRAMGLTSRATDQFGTLLAAADFALHDEPADSDSREALCRQVCEVSKAAAVEAGDDWERCLDRLMTARCEVFRSGRQHAVGYWVNRLAGLTWPIPGTTPNPADMDEASEAMETMGLRLGLMPGTEDGEQLKALFISSGHEALARIFAGSHWQGKSGAVPVYAAALKRCPGAMSAGQGIYFAGRRTRGTWLPLDVVMHGTDALAERAKYSKAATQMLDGGAHVDA